MKKSVAGLCTGIACGWLTYRILKSRQYLPPEKVLQLVRSQADGEYELDNAWIMQRHEAETEDGPELYKGGWYTEKTGTPCTYTFEADAATGILKRVTETQ